MVLGIVGMLMLGCSSNDRDSLSSEDSPVDMSGPSADAIEQPSELTPEGRRVTLDVGHCYVEPIRVRGKTWVTKRTYFGYGGGVPRRFTPEGTFVVSSATEATFIADGGAEVRFKVAPTRMPSRGCR